MIFFIIGVTAIVFFVLGWFVGTNGRPKFMRLMVKSLDAAEALWGVVANVDQGTWNQSDVWRGAAERAREMYFKALDATRGMDIEAMRDAFVKWEN